MPTCVHNFIFGMHDINTCHKSLRDSKALYIRRAVFDHWCNIIDIKNEIEKYDKQEKYSNKSGLRSYESNMIWFSCVAILK